MQDWTGNSTSVFKTLGASNHSYENRQKEDYYATDPKAVTLLLEVEKFNHNIWEPACGEGHISKELEKHGYEVVSTDLYYRGFGTQMDFLEENPINDFNGDIITNPPYKYALEFCQRGIEILNTGNKMAMFLKLQFLEGKKRKNFFLSNPPKTIYVSSSRLECGKNGKFTNGSAVCYAWFVWEKGFTGNTIIKWIN